jgi:hypothetical protein
MIKINSDVIKEKRFMSIFFCHYLINEKVLEIKVVQIAHFSLM